MAEISRHIRNHAALSPFTSVTAYKAAQSSVLPDSMKPDALNSRNLTSPAVLMRVIERCNMAVIAALPQRRSGGSKPAQIGQNKSIRFKALGRGLGASEGGGKWILI